MSLETERENINAKQLVLNETSCEVRRSCPLLNPKSPPYLMSNFKYLEQKQTPHKMVTYAYPTTSRMIEKKSFLLCIATWELLQFTRFV